MYIVNPGAVQANFRGLRSAGRRSIGIGRRGRPNRERGRGQRDGGIRVRGLPTPNHAARSHLQCASTRIRFRWPPSRAYSCEQPRVHRPFPE